MEFNINSMKLRAKSLIKATSPNPAVASLIIMAVAYTMAIMFEVAISSETTNTVLLVISAILALFKIFIDVGYSWYTLAIAREENPKISEMFQPLTTFSIKSFIAVVLKNIIISVFSCLFIVPGIIAFYWFRPLYFIAKDNPEMSVFKMLSASIHMMKGNKMTWFKLDLSFLVWFIINIVTCGLFNIYSLQIISTTYAEYYDFLKGKDEF